jgi:hypothetical protein
MNNDVDSITIYSIYMGMDGYIYIFTIYNITIFTIIHYLYIGYST